MIFRQFHASDGQLSYLFADSVTRNAAILDPHLALEHDYIDLIEHLDLKLEYVIETHAHESHFSAAPLLCDATGAYWFMSHLIADTVKARPLEQGESVFMGEESFDVLETPGHSACSLCFRWRDRVFTGHTLLAGRVGDCGRPDADPRQLYDSITQGLYLLPAETMVFPGFGLEGKRESTIGIEREQNRDLNAATDRTVFLARKRCFGAGSQGVQQTGVYHPATDLYQHRKVGRR